MLARRSRFGKYPVHFEIGFHDVKRRGQDIGDQVAVLLILAVHRPAEANALDGKDHDGQRQAKGGNKHDGSLAIAFSEAHSFSSPGATRGPALVPS